MVSVIEVNNLSYCYPDGTAALSNASLQIEKGSKVALMGRNGAGKSTLLLHLNALFLPQQGEVKVLGNKLGSSNEQWVRSKVGLVFQDPDDQVFSSTVWEDVAFGPKNMGWPPDTVSLRVEEALKAVDMAQYAHKAPYHLSYGQKKRVAIAGVLVLQPEILILDEPMAYLDPQGQEGLLQILNAISNQGKTIIIATHDVDFAAEWADQVIILQAGTVLAAGTTDLLTDEELIKKAGLRLPTVTSIFREFSGGDPLPKTISEARRRLKQMGLSKSINSY